MATNNNIIFRVFFISFLISICYGSGVLYGINYDDNYNINLQEISTNPWSIKIVKSIPGFYVFDGLMDIDKVNKIYYLVVYRIATRSYELIGLELKTGEIVKTVELRMFADKPEVFEEFKFFALDYVTSDVFIIGQNSSDPNLGWTFLRLAPKTGAIKILKHIPRYHGTGYNSLGFYDAAHDIVFITVNTTFIGYEGRTGDQDTYLWSILTPTLTYDTKTELLYGFANQNGAHIIVSVNGRSGEIKQLPNFADSTYDTLATNPTIDPESRQLFALFHGKQIADGKNQILVNVDTGKVTASGFACPWEANTCPWNVAYDN